MNHKYDEKDKKDKKKDKSKSTSKKSSGPAEWQLWTAIPAIREEDFLRWRPVLDQIRLPAPAVGEAWPTDILRPISVDYGRSHFIFYGDALNTGHAELQRQQYILYPNAAAAAGQAIPKADRVAFLAELVGGAAAEVWAAECELTSPSRNRVIARVKFELLARWVSANCSRLSADESRIAALYLMYFSTQGPLAAIKHVASETVPPALAKELKDVFFACWRGYAHVENGELMLRVSFRNYRPKDGVWQVAYAVRESPAQWELEFTISATRGRGDGVDLDKGKLEIRRGGNVVEPFTQEERNKYYGVWWPATNTVVRYSDTCPTF